MFRIDFNKLRFLVCDDNPHMRRILRTLLHSFGAREVYESEDGATALEMYGHYVPDIVITDWSMPIFDGLELAQMLRQPESKGNPYAPIIMLTGHSEKRRVTVARDAGVTEFLAKPISAQGALSAHPERRRQSSPIHQDQDLFRPGPPAQYEQHLYRTRAPRRRRGRDPSAAVAAR
jgi:CheY-like chemotaxis protein